MCHGFSQHQVPPPAAASRVPTGASLAAADEDDQTRRKPGGPPYAKVRLVATWLCGVFALILCLLLVSFYIAQATLEGKSRQPVFQIESFSISNLNITENQISANWTVGVSITNPNRLFMVFYDSMEVFVLYSKAPGKVLSSAVASNFVHKPHDKTVILFKLVSWLEGLNQMDANSMAGDVIRDSGILDFEILLQVQFMLVDVLGWDMKFYVNTDKIYEYDMVCKGVKVLISPLTSPPVNATGTATEIPELKLYEEDLTLT